ncbi:MAG: serine/threonine-protein kinase [Bradymonadia bacterium]
MTQPLTPPPEMLLALCRQGAVCPVCGKPPAPGDVTCLDHHRLAVPQSALAHQDRAPLLGQIIAERYALVDFVGGGGMGVVYQGIDLRLERVVAVKTLHGFMAAGGDERMRFEREARALSRLAGDHSVTIFDYGTVASGPLTGLGYIVMALVKGESLEDRITRGPIAVAQAVQVVEHVARALTEAHKAGIVHRDLKPSNILMTQTPDGREKAVVIDFGIARLKGSVRTNSGVIMGTPHYMAPEQCGGENNAIDARTDVYALGIVLYEMLLGVPPFDASEALQIVLKQVSVPPPHLPGKEPPWPAVDVVIQQTLAKDPAARFPSVQAMAEALERAVMATAVNVAVPVETPPPLPAPLPAPVQPRQGTVTTTPPMVGMVATAERELSSQRRPLWPVFALLGVLLVSGLAWAFWPSGQQPSLSDDPEVVTMRVGAGAPSPVDATTAVAAPDAALPDAAPLEATPDAEVPDATPAPKPVKRRNTRRTRARKRRTGRVSERRQSPPQTAEPLIPDPKIKPNPPSKPSGPLIQPLIDEP